MAIGNLIFKAIGCLIFVAGMQLAIRWISPTSTRTRARQVLHFHVAFNVTIAVLFFLLHRPDRAARDALRPEAAAPARRSSRATSTTAALATPALALANAARETLRIGDIIEQMLNGMLEVIRTNDAASWSTT